MAARDLTKTKIASELYLLKQRVENTDQMAEDYRTFIYHHLLMAMKAVHWENLAIPFDIFSATKVSGAFEEWEGDEE